MKEIEDKAMSAERGHLEAIKLKEKEDMVAWLKEEGELVKEHSREADVLAQLDHCEVLCRPIENTAQVNKEQAWSTKGRAKATKY